MASKQFPATYAVNVHGVRRITGTPTVLQGGQGMKRGAPHPGVQGWMTEGIPGGDNASGDS